MYEINTHNLKLYLLASGIIFILTNGFPILNMFNDIDDNYNYRKNHNYNHNYNNKNNHNLRGDNFIIVNNNNYYSINATVIKQSMMYNTNTHFYTGSVILKYNNDNDSYHYCKIDIDIPEQKRNNIIYEFIYKYYNLSKNNIQIYCNNNECIQKLYTYDDTNINDNGKYTEIICNILSSKQLNDEL